jgi:hypothetical protein
VAGSRVWSSQLAKSVEIFVQARTSIFMRVWGN